ncbi:hypothetical protein WMY93_032427 [Mugilogobius chulae]|uniref:Deoxynucleoside kinase domain-containing protein n=1 Tax=Mugilogobius chulae TaxID=88201 RepID=A0AAW0MVN2_9GOBI
MATPPKRARSSDTTSRKHKKISIEGNIAAGKSTFVRLLEKTSDDWEVIPEPIAKWCNVQTDKEDVYEELSSSQKSGGNLLQMLYSKPTRWSYTLPSYAGLRQIRFSASRAPSPFKTVRSRNNQFPVLTKNQCIQGQVRNERGNRTGTQRYGNRWGGKQVRTT